MKKKRVIVGMAKKSAARLDVLLEYALAKGESPDTEPLTLELLAKLLKVVDELVRMRGGREQALLLLEAFKAGEDERMRLRDRVSACLDRMRAKMGNMDKPCSPEVNKAFGDALVCLQQDDRKSALLILESIEAGSVR